MLPARLSKQKGKLITTALREVHALDWAFREDGALVSLFSRPLPDDVAAVVDSIESGRFRSQPLGADAFDLILDALDVYNTIVVDSVDIPWSADMQDLAIELNKIKPRAGEPANAGVA